MDNNPILQLLEDCLKSIPDKIDEGALSEIRNCINGAGTGDSSVFQLWDAIEEQIGKHYKHKDQPALIKLREKYIESLFIHEKNRLDTIFKASSEKGWQEWIILIAKSITQFKYIFQSKFCEFEFPFPGDKIEGVKFLKKAIQYIIQGYWAGAYEPVEYLTGFDFLQPGIKSVLFVILADIQQFHFYKPYKAEKFFDSAEKISSDHHRVISSRAKFLSEQGNVIESKKCYSRLISLYPKKSGGYIGMGNIAEKEKEEAEIWYKNAVKYAPGDADGYIELAKYYIRTGSDGMKDLVNDLKEQVLLISPELEYDFSIETGYEYQNANKYEEAISHFNFALNIDKLKQSAFSRLGFLFLDHNHDQDFEKARSYFEKVMELLPDSVDSYLNIAYAYEVEKKWSEALKWYEKCPDVVLEYRDRIFAAKGEAYRQLKDFKMAETELNHSFACDKESPWATIFTENLAKDCYQLNDDVEKAMKLYNRILENKGEPYKGDYFNLLGNLEYYNSSNEEAVEQYQKAIEISPANAVFRRNLSGAYQEIKEYEKAIVEIETAYNIDSDESIKNEKLAGIHNAKGNDLFSAGKYAEAISEYTETINLVPFNDIYHSNLAGAYKNLINTISRSAAFDKAIFYYQKAWDLNPKEEYTNQINSIQKRKDLLLYYGEKNSERLPLVTPIAIEIAGDLIPLVEAEGDALSPHFQETIKLLREGLQYELGHKQIPGIRIRGNENDLPDGTYVIMINEIPLVSGNVRMDKLFVDKTVGQLKFADIPGEETINPANGSAGAWIPAELKEKAENAGITVWDAVEYMILHLFSVLRKNFAEFITVQDTSEEIELKASNYYQEISDAPGGIVRFTDVLKILAEEEVPVKELESICETYLSEKNSPVYEIVEELRCHEKIRPFLVGNKFSNEYCNVFQLGSDITGLINSGIFTNGDAALLALEPQPAQDILTAVRDKVRDLPPSVQNPVIITEDSRIRRHVRKLVELEFPYLAVMSKREIINKVQTLSTITLE